MPEPLQFVRLEPEDLFAIERQPSQDLLLGTSGAFDAEDAELVARQRIAWTARRGGEIIACFGIVEPFAGVHGIAWSLLSPRLGASHLRLTRFCASVLAQCGLQRVEVLARAADIGPPGVQAGGLETALAMHPLVVSAECRWAALLGFHPAHFLHRYGAASEPHMLFEWFPEYLFAPRRVSGEAGAAAGGHSALRRAGRAPEIEPVRELG